MIIRLFEATMSQNIQSDCCCNVRYKKTCFHACRQFYCVENVVIYWNKSPSCCCTTPLSVCRNNTWQLLCCVCCCLLCLLCVPSLPSEMLHLSSGFLLSDSCSAVECEHFRSGEVFRSAAHEFKTRTVSFFSPAARIHLVCMYHINICTIGIILRSHYM